MQYELSDARREEATKGNYLLALECASAMKKFAIAASPPFRQFPAW